MKPPRAALLLIVLCALAAPRASIAATLQGTVIRVTDGDSVMFRPDEAGAKPLKLRLEGLDAPERCQPGGTQASEALSARVLNKRVQASTRTLDDYGRTVATISLNGEDVGAWMVAQGYAWARGYRNAPAPYAKQELEARAARRGVFADPQAEEPRLFRKRHGACD